MNPDMTPSDRLVELIALAADKGILRRVACSNLN
jgi:hypothetical protein